MQEYSRQPSASWRRLVALLAEISREGPVRSNVRALRYERVDGMLVTREPDV